MNTKLRSVKKGEPVTLAGVSVAVEKVDNSYRRVTVTDANGRALVLASQYGLEVLVPAEPEKETKHVVKGEIAGVTINESFDDAYQASVRRSELESHGATVDVAAEEVEILF